MDASVAEALRILDEIASSPIPTGPVRLSRGYLRAVRLLDSRPENQDGADKTWVERAIREFRGHYARARRVR
jgi:hypothetical protein